MDGRVLPVPIICSRKYGSKRAARRSRDLLGIKTDLQTSQTAQSRVLPPFQIIARDFGMPESSQQGIEGDLPLQARQGGPKTKMRRPTKSQVAVIGAL